MEKGSLLQDFPLIVRYHLEDSLNVSNATVLNIFSRNRIVFRFDMLPLGAPKIFVVLVEKLSDMRF